MPSASRIRCHDGRDVRTEKIGRSKILELISAHFDLRPARSATICACTARSTRRRRLRALRSRGRGLHLERTDKADELRPRPGSDPTADPVRIGRALSPRPEPARATYAEKPMAHQYIYTTHKLSRRHPPDKETSRTSRCLPSGAKIGVLATTAPGRRPCCGSWPGRHRVRRRGQLAPNATVGLLEQEPELDPARTCAATSRGSRRGAGAARSLQRAVDELLRGDRGRVPRVQEQIDAVDGWNLDTTLEYAMDALRCPPQMPRSPPSPAASAGGSRSVAFCCDSPTCCCSTSHQPLDAESVAWLEQHCAITRHDRRRHP